MRPTDPRIRQALNDLSITFEHLSNSTQTALFSFHTHYLSPCLHGTTACLSTCLQPCFPTREELLRRRAQTRSRAEFAFDFYDDWDTDASGLSPDAGGSSGILGWGNDELDRLLAGSGAHPSDTRAGKQPGGRKRGMSYGTRGHDSGDDPTLIPSTSVFGFLERLPWKIGGRGVRYKPSAADLQEHPGQLRRDVGEGDPLMEGGSDEEEASSSRKKRRKRSGTVGSGESTSDSFRSRGDLFPSDEEDDAVPLDDEFAMVLERRTTGSTHRTEDTTSANGKKRSASRMTSKSGESKEAKGKRGSSISLKSEGASVEEVVAEETEVPTLTDLKREEEMVQLEEEQEVERKRVAAEKLARERGLSVAEDERVPAQESKDKPSVAVVVEEAPSASQVESIDPPATTPVERIDPSIPSQLPDSIDEPPDLGS